MKKDNAKKVLKKNPLISIVMGSASDYDIMAKAEEILEKFAAPYEILVVSAHRTPDLMYDHAKNARERGIKCIIAGAGGAAHLPGMLSALTTVPVLGVPVPSKHLKGLDSLLSIVQMPGGIPTATFAIGEAGAKNAALFALSILALTDEKIAAQLLQYRQDLAEAALKGNAKIRKIRRNKHS